MEGEPGRVYSEKYLNGKKKGKSIISKLNSLFYWHCQTIDIDLFLC